MEFVIAHIGSEMVGLAKSAEKHFGIQNIPSDISYFIFKVFF